ncbi:Cupin 2 conserved barrel domain protein [Haloterrigena turkmenica DSM 5511]|uniref:Cupin 2 conserved barrel domain protein n=1 Tax=Haloterrigena turkmenica (strain ATCC 51198 / DSM 5511 / JCM 9101 / NCIMB 13204 / VKM B-1734 / 4k) TaxID=543526 RepID=D2RTH6_HALTV|nr:cupin domain-containing protein [Haloterrigena turkmenica]ADB59019.1 Cupin 2 conserved barrel domain protein [Haloterrigena turkmenica DSM 5511]
MEYSVIDPDDLESVEDRPCDLRRVSDAAGLENVAINRFRAEPGEQLPLAYHYHERQEEAFVVLSGTLHVETPEGELEVPEGDVFTAQPESAHRAYNPADATETVEVVAVGAPPVSDDAVPYEPDA